MVATAAEHGVSRIVATTAPDNIASQRTLIRAGFRLTHSGEELRHYEALPDVGH